MTIWFQIYEHPIFISWINNHKIHTKWYPTLKMTTLSDLVIIAWNIVMNGFNQENVVKLLSVKVHHALYVSEQGENKWVPGVFQTQTEHVLLSKLLFYLVIILLTPSPDMYSVCIDIYIITYNKELIMVVVGYS